MERFIKRLLLLLKRTSLVFCRLKNWGLHLNFNAWVSKIKMKNLDLKKMDGFTLLNLPIKISYIQISMNIAKANLEA